MKECPRCKQNKPATSYNRRRDGSPGSYCKVCQSAYYRGYYKEHKAEHNARRYKSQKKRRVELSALVDELKSKPCMDCGGSFPTCCMDFDHVRGVKKTEVGRLRGVISSRRMLMEEIAKCDLVCSNCHRIRTQKRRKNSW